jgi:hypothetical protein
VITLDMQLHGARFAQYQGFNFNSMVRFGNRFLSANSTGIFTIGGNTDNGAPIQSEMELPAHDLGTQNKKRIRFLYLGYETSGTLSVKATFDQKKASSATKPIANLEKDVQQRNRVSFPRNVQGRYITINVKNVNGAFFGINSIEILPVILSSGIMR